MIPRNSQSESILDRIISAYFRFIISFCYHRTAILLYHCPHDSSKKTLD
ncbi:hypothetical protein HMPREF0239_01639 [Clostridium sp. ATCC BAA-442]|nr:hypothetical protein HMPREF0239_01639 [Clostridium sp. ATCC BAA-442]